MRRKAGRKEEAKEEILSPEISKTLDANRKKKEEKRCNKERGICCEDRIKRNK